MLKAWSQHRVAVIIFLLIGMLNYIFGGHNPWIMVAVLSLIFSVFGIGYIFFEKQESYLFVQIGFVVGFFSGQFMWKLIQMISPQDFSINLEPYIVMVFSYLGCYMAWTSKYIPENLIEISSENNNPLYAEFDSKLLDTSVIIDGRINDIIATGFITGTVIVAKFVLNEIHALADSKDSIKRSRARRGLDVLNELREQKNITLKLVSNDYPDIRGVDSKLIALAKEKSYVVFTNDYNLNKIAHIEGVSVLNINDLINALKPVLLPGEELELEVLREGKEPGQGLGYLADGTMVVVAQGAHLVGKKMNVRVTSTLQTSAGRIIFTEAE